MREVKKSEGVASSVGYGSYWGQRTEMSCRKKLEWMGVVRVRGLKLRI